MGVVAPRRRASGDECLLLVNAAHATKQKRLGDGKLKLLNSTRASPVRRTSARDLDDRSGSRVASCRSSPKFSN